MILLETADKALTRRRKIRAMVRSCARANEPNHRASGELANGVQLAKLVEQLATKAELTGAPPWIICDHNGENHRAVEWGNAVARLACRSHQLADARFWYPVTAFGDCGAASGAVHVQYALEAFERDYAQRPTAMLISCSDGADRAGMVVASSLEEARRG